MRMARQLALHYFVSPDARALAHRAAQYFVDQARAAVAARGRARIAISGGSTPKATFALLADPAEPYRAQMPWEQIELFWVDERTVPPTDAESNYRMTKETLLDKVPIPAGQVHRILGELTPEQAADQYEFDLRRTFRLEGAEGPSFDLLALGMGDDAHTASLFPYTEAIHELGRLVVANEVPQKKTWRVTLTWPVINQARNVFFLIAGADKAGPVHEVFTGPRDPERLPSQLIWPASGILTVFLDSDAAAQLPTPGADGAGLMEKTR